METPLEIIEKITKYIDLNCDKKDIGYFLVAASVEGLVAYRMTIHNDDIEGLLAHIMKSVKEREKEKAHELSRPKQQHSIRHRAFSRSSKDRTDVD